ncbi:unnamed protein product [Agarophyton chilense]
MAFSSPSKPILHVTGGFLPACKTTQTPSRRKVFTAPHRRALRAELPKEPAAVVKTEQLIRKFWSLTSTKKYSTVVSCFTDDAVYHDGSFPKPCIGKEAIMAHFSKFENVLPSSFLFVVDDIVAGADRAGARWHVETSEGTPLPFSRGLSMYNIVERNGEFLISEAWEYSETPIKVPAITLPLLRLAGSLLRLRDASNRKSGG